MKQVTREEVDQVSQVIGSDVTKVMEKAIKECNEILSLYGLEIEVGFQVKTKQ